MEHIVQRKTLTHKLDYAEGFVREVKNAARHGCLNIYVTDPQEAFFIADLIRLGLAEYYKKTFAP